MTQPAPTVTELRERGYLVRYQHLRRYLPTNPPTAMFMSMGEAKWAAAHPVEHRQQRPEEQPEIGWTLSPYGGKTICTIQRDDGYLVATGETTVYELDLYNKRLGRIKSFGRAVGEFQRVQAADRDATFFAAPGEVA